MKNEAVSNWARALESVVDREMRSMCTVRSASDCDAEEPEHDHKLTLVEELADSDPVAQTASQGVTPLELAHVILEQPDEEHVPPELWLPPLCRLVLLVVIHRSNDDLGVLRCEISRRELAKATGIDRSNIFSRQIPVIEEAGYLVRERSTLAKPGGFRLVLPTFERLYAITQLVYGDPMDH